MGISSHGRMNYTHYKYYYYCTTAVRTSYLPLLRYDLRIQITVQIEYHTPVCTCACSCTALCTVVTSLLDDATNAFRSTHRTSHERSVAGCHDPRLQIVLPSSHGHNIDSTA